MFVRCSDCNFRLTHYYGLTRLIVFPKFHRFPFIEIKLEYPCFLLWSYARERRWFRLDLYRAIMAMSSANVVQFGSISPTVIPADWLFGLKTIRLRIPDTISWRMELLGERMAWQRTIDFHHFPASAQLPGAWCMMHSIFDNSTYSLYKSAQYIYIYIYIYVHVMMHIGLFGIHITYNAAISMIWLRPLDVNATHNYNEFRTELQNLSFRKLHLKISPATLSSNYSNLTLLVPCV